jgi:hypothetical protein
VPTLQYSSLVGRLVQEFEISGSNFYQPVTSSPGLVRLVLKLSRPRKDQHNPFRAVFHEAMLLFFPLYTNAVSKSWHCNLVLSRAHYSMAKGAQRLFEDEHLRPLDSRWERRENPGSQPRVIRSIIRVQNTLGGILKESRMSSHAFKVGHSKAAHVLVPSGWVPDAGWREV